MHKNFREQVNPSSNRSQDDPMYQYFGDNSSNKENEQKGTDATIELAGQVIQKIDNSRLEKAGYWILIVVLVVLAIAFLIEGMWSGMWSNVTGSVLLIAVTIFVMRKVRFAYSLETNFYLANATNTLKAMFHHFKLTAKIIPYAHTVLFCSVFTMMLETFILRWFLFSPLSGLIYTIGFYGMWIGVILLFAKRATKEAYRGLLLAYVYYILVILLNGLTLHMVNIFTVLSALLVWTLAGWMKHCAIEDVKVENK